MSVITEPTIDPSLDILSNSKKIKKIPKLQPTMSSKKEKSDEGTPTNSKKYKTFQTSMKKAILFDIKRGIMKINNLPFNDKELDSEELLKLVGKVELGAYNRLLKEVLERHVVTFSASQKSLTQWRKKIKGWLYTSEKPEYRGSPVVTSEKLPAFREEVIKILKSLNFRCFVDLRQRILAVLERYHKANVALKESQPFNPNVCSKHWWFNFMQKNTDIKDMWEKIPLKRETSKHHLDSHASQQSTESQSQEMEEEKAPNLLMVDPIFSGQMIPPRPFLHNNGTVFPQASELLGDMRAKQSLEGMPDMAHFLRKAAWERVCQQAFLMKLSLINNLQIPPFQNMPNNESAVVKTELKIEAKDQPKVEAGGAKREEGETKVKMEEETNRLVKKSEE